MTILCVERAEIDPAHRAAHGSDLHALLGAMRAADGFLWADASWSVADAEVVTVCSEWRTEATLDAFLSGEAYRRFTVASEVRIREASTVRRFASA